MSLPRLFAPVLSVMFLSCMGSAVAQETLVLDETAFFRSHYTFNWDRVCPELIKKQGEEFFGKYFKRLKKKALKDMKSMGIDKTAHDWREHVYFARHCLHIESPAPPADWREPDFDDSDWLHQRNSFLTGSGLLRKGVRQACFRAWFEVKDKDRTNLKLDLAYRGGVRVFLNGVEIARGHLPDGDVSVDTPAAAYPEEASRLLAEELNEAELKKYNARKSDNYLFYLGRRGNPRLNQLRNRRLKDIALPRKLLREGANLLAIELHRSDVHPRIRLLDAGAHYLWSHVGLVSLKLVNDGNASVCSAQERPKGLQVWVRDVHARTYDTDYLQPGAPPGVIQVVGARNGVYGSQLSVGTSREIESLKIHSTALTLKAGGKQIDQKYVRVFPMVPHLATDMKMLGNGRYGSGFGRSAEEAMALKRCAWKKSSKSPKPQVKVFGHIDWKLKANSSEGVVIPARSSRTFWVSIKIPEGAAPGTYQGRLQVIADEQAPIDVPVEVTVSAWRVPGPQRFHTFVGTEQSPYGVAKHYKVPLWSDRHFDLMESSFFHMGRIGGEWLNIPVLINTEFGNGEDMLIPWIRKPDGSLSFDYTNLDRYLDMALRYCGTPSVINFAVMHGADGNVSEVLIRDETSGKAEKVQMHGPDASQKHRYVYWGAFAKSLYAHMKARGLEKSMYWGMAWDLEGDPGLKALMKTFVPSVKWTRGSHREKTDDYYQAVSTIYYAGNLGRQGWKAKRLHLVNPRNYNKVINIQNDYPAFIIRALPERALARGRQGIGRIGLDYGKAHFAKFKQTGGTVCPGFPIKNLFYFGEKGAQTCTRAETLLEGIQLTEIRIFLEMVCEYDLVNDELKTEISNVLKQHLRATAFYPVMHADYDLASVSHGWRERSARMYALAGKAALAIGMTLDSYVLETEMPIRGKKSISAKLLNMTETPKEWMIVEHPAWVEPVTKKGTVTIGEDIRFNLNSSSLKPGESVEGKVMIKDVSGKTVLPLSLKVKTGQVMDLPFDTAAFYNKDRNVYQVDGKDQRAVFNVPPGEGLSRSFMFFNKSGAVLNWNAKSSDAWLKISPHQGALKPGASIELTLTATAPKGDQPSFHQSRCIISEDGGAAALSKCVEMYVIPAYAKPVLPAGSGSKLSSVIKGKGLSCKSRSGHMRGTHKWIKTKLHLPTNGLKFIDGGKVLVSTLPQETRIDLKGKAIRGFSAQVAIESNYSEKKTLRKGSVRTVDTKAVFEIYVDGQLRVSSGLVRVGEEPRLLAVGDLEGAEELKLVSRFDVPEQIYFKSYDIGFWRDALLYSE